MIFFGPKSKKLKNRCLRVKKKVRLFPFFHGMSEL